MRIYLAFLLLGLFGLFGLSSAKKYNARILIVQSDLVTGLEDKDYPDTQQLDCNDCGPYACGNCVSKKAEQRDSNNRRKFVEGALAGPNTPSVSLRCDFTNTDANSQWNCEKKWTALSAIGADNVVPFYGIMITSGSIPIFDGQPGRPFFDKMRDFAATHGIRIVSIYSSPFASGAADTSFTSNPFKAVLAERFFPNSLVTAGHWQGAPCDGVNNIAPACVPAAGVNHFTIKFANEAKGAFCGGNAGQSSLPCDLQSDTLNQGYHFMVVKSVAFDSVNFGKVTPVLYYDILDAYGLATGEDANLGEKNKHITADPRMILAAVAPYPYKDQAATTKYGDMLVFHFAQASFDFQSKLFVPVWYNYLTNNIFLGDRRVYLTPQIDDFLFSTKFRDELPEQIFPNAIENPLGSKPGEPKKWAYRDSVKDIDSLIQWQDKFRQSLPRGSDFTIEPIFNGQGTPGRVWQATPLQQLYDITGVANPFAAAADGKHPTYDFDDMWHYLTRGTSSLGTSPLLEFYWVSHTWAHLSLTCYDFADYVDEVALTYKNARPDTPDTSNDLFQTTSYAHAQSSFKKNRDFFNELMSTVGSVEIQSLWASFDSLVPPKISGLYNPNSLKAELDEGIFNIVGDNTRNGLNAATAYQRTEWAPERCVASVADPNDWFNKPDNLTAANPYHALWTVDNPALDTVTAYKAVNNRYDGQFVLPRWATEIYFDASTDLENTYMYNYIVHRKDPVEEVPFATILQREADRVVNNLVSLRRDAYMFHQANLRFYETSGSPIVNPIMFTKDWQNNAQVPTTCLTCQFCEQVYEKWRKHSTLPLATLRQSELAKAFLDRMDLDHFCDVTATLEVDDATKLATSVELKTVAKACDVDAVTGRKPSHCDGRRPARCPISFTGSEAVIVNDPAFLVTELDENYVPAKKAGNKAIYRTIFGTERSFYVDLAPGVTKAVQFLTPRSFVFEPFDDSKIVLQDSQGNNIDGKVLPPMTTNEMDIVIKNVDTVDHNIAVGRIQSPFSTDTADLSITVAAGTSKTVKISVDGNVAGRHQQRVTFSAVSRIFEVTLTKVVANNGVTLTSNNVAIAVGTEIAFAEHAAYVASNKALKLSVNTGAAVTVQVSVMTAKSAQLLAFSTSVSSVQVPAGGTSVDFVLASTGLLSGDFTGTLVVSGPNIYQTWPLKTKVTKPNTPLRAQYHRVDLGRIRLGGGVGQAVVKVCNDGAQDVKFKAGFGFGDLSAVQTGTNRRSLEEMKKLDATENEAAYCVSDEPTYRLQYTGDTIKAGGCLDITVIASTRDQTINITCGATFFKSFSIINADNPHQRNIIIDVIHDVYESALSPVRSCGDAAPGSATQGKTMTSTSCVITSGSCGVKVGAGIANLVEGQLGQSFVEVTAITCRIVQDGQAQTVPSNQVWVTIDDRQRLEVTPTLKCIAPGKGTIRLVLPTDRTDVTAIPLEYPYECLAPTEICTFYVDDSRDGADVGTVGGQNSRFEIYGLGVCADCNRVQYFVAGSRPLKVVDSWVIGWGEAIFSVMKCGWKTGTESDAGDLPGRGASTVASGRSAFYHFYRDTGSGNNFNATVQFTNNNGVLSATVTQNSKFSTCTDACGGVKALSFGLNTRQTCVKADGITRDDATCSAASACLFEAGNNVRTFEIGKANSALITDVTIFFSSSCVESSKVVGVRGCKLTALDDPNNRENIIAVKWYTGTNSDSANFNSKPGVYHSAELKGVANLNQGYGSFIQYANHVRVYNFTNAAYALNALQPPTNLALTTLKGGVKHEAALVDTTPANWQDLRAEFKSVLESKDANGVRFADYPLMNFRVLEMPRDAFPEEPFEFALFQAIECINDFSGLFGSMPALCKDKERQCERCCRRTDGSAFIASCGANGGGQDCVFTSPGKFELKEFIARQNGFTKDMFMGIASHPVNGKLYAIAAQPNTGISETNFGLYSFDANGSPIKYEKVLVVVDKDAYVPTSEVLDAAFNPCDNRLYFTVRNAGLFSIDVSNLPANTAAEVVRLEPSKHYSPSNGQSEFRWNAISFSESGSNVAGFESYSETTDSKCSVENCGMRDGSTCAYMSKRTPNNDGTDTVDIELGACAVKDNVGWVCCTTADCKMSKCTGKANGEVCTEATQVSFTVPSATTVLDLQIYDNLFQGQASALANDICALGLQTEGDCGVGVCATSINIAPQFTCPPWQNTNSDGVNKQCRGSPATLGLVQGNTATWSYQHSYNGLKMTADVTISTVSLGKTSSTFRAEIKNHRATGRVRGCEDGDCAQGRASIVALSMHLPGITGLASGPVVSSDVPCNPKLRTGKSLAATQWTKLEITDKVNGYTPQSLCIHPAGNNCNGGDVKNGIYSGRDKTITFTVTHDARTSFDTISVACPVVKWQTCVGSFHISGCPQSVQVVPPPVPPPQPPASTCLYIMELASSNPTPKKLCSCGEALFPKDVRGVQFSLLEDRLLVYSRNSGEQVGTAGDITTVWRVSLSQDRNSCTIEQWKQLEQIGGVSSVATISSCTNDCNTPPPVCVPGTYYDATAFQCKPCEFPCETCTSATKCLTCPPKCFPNGAESCEWCPEKCTECLSPTKCTQCIEKHTTQKQPDGSTICVPCDPSCAACAPGKPNKCTECPFGCFLDNGKCPVCNARCRACEGAPDFCTACPTDYDLVKTPNGQTCRSGCPEGTVKNTATQECDCPPGKLLVRNPQFKCVPHQTLQNCAGVILSALDGTTPVNGDFGTQQNDFLPLPGGHQFVPDEPKFRECLSCYAWGTICFVYANGNAYTYDGTLCGTDKLEKKTVNGVDLFRPKSAGYKVLIMRKFAGNFQVPKFRTYQSIAQWKDFKGGFDYIEDPTSAANEAGVISVMRASNQDALQGGATWSIYGLPTQYKPGFRICAESMIVADDPSKVNFPDKYNNRYSINVDIFYGTDQNNFFTTQFPERVSNILNTGNVCPDFGFFTAFPRNVVKTSSATEANWNKRCVDVKPRGSNVLRIDVTLLFDPCDAIVPKDAEVCSGVNNAHGWFRNVEFLPIDENVIGNAGFEYPKNNFLTTGLGGGQWIPYWQAGPLSGITEDVGFGMVYKLQPECPPNDEECRSEPQDLAVQQNYFFDDSTRNQEVVAGCKAYPGKGRTDPANNGAFNYPRSFYVSAKAREVNPQATGIPSGHEFSIYLDFFLGKDAQGQDRWSFGHFLPFEAGNNQWHRVEGILFAPDEVYAVFVNLLYKGRTAGSGAYALFDDVRVVPRPYQCEHKNPVPGDCYGDPHILTFDGLSYDMMTQGEYILTRNTPDAQGKSQLEVQVRTGSVPGNPVVATINSGVAIWYGGVRRLAITVDESTADANFKNSLWPKVVIYKQVGNNIVGEDIAVPTGADLNGGLLHVYEKGIYVSHSYGKKATLGESSRTFYFRDIEKKYDVVIQVRAGTALGFIRITVNYPQGPPRTATQGILGNNNGNPNDDFEKLNQDGKTVTAMNKDTVLANANTLNREFIDSWLIRDEAKSAFKYTNNRNPLFYYSATIPGGAFSVDTIGTPELRASVTAACKKLNLQALEKQCILDGLLLGAPPAEYVAVQQANDNVAAANVECSSQCATCAPNTSGRFCATCKANRVLYKGFDAVGTQTVQTCIDRCSTGQFTVQEQGVAVCKDCSTACKACAGSPQKCTECPAGRVLNGDVCVIQCPDGMYETTANNIKVCKPCSAKCRTCAAGPEGCVTCYEGFSYFMSQCLSLCPTNFYPANGKCEECTEAQRASGKNVFCTAICPDASQGSVLDLGTCVKKDETLVGGAGAVGGVTVVTDARLISAPPIPKEFLNTGIPFAEVTITATITVPAGLVEMYASLFFAAGTTSLQTMDRTYLSTQGTYVLNVTKYVEGGVENNLTLLEKAFLVIYPTGPGDTTLLKKLTIKFEHKVRAVDRKVDEPGVVFNPNLGGN
jgi:hypothetical protein